MNIAIVAPSSVPFVIGGAENLWWGLLTALNTRPGTQAELIKQPSPERNLAELLDSYARFAQLDLRHFDLVISTKYPAWAIEHRNHIVYLQHTLRGLYDTYPASLATSFDPDALTELSVPLTLVHALRDTQPHGLSVAGVVEVLQQAMQRAPEHPQWNFPGPLSRAVVRLLDAIAMQPGRIAHYAAISHTVAAREGYFPRGTPVTVHHHPTGLPRVDTQGYDAIFTASRLDRPKRVDLLIEAYLQCELEVPLRIAGSGPDEPRLRELAAGHPGIQFLGRVTDAQLMQEYARALFVPFVPRDEDYGLITVESMRAGKAVLTTTDSGGPTELVEHGKNGLIVSPSVDALAGAMRRLSDDREATLAMGAAGAARIDAISWDGLCDALLAHSRPAAVPHQQQPQPQHQHQQIASAAISRRAKPRLAVINTFPIAPVVSGGKLRLHGLYARVAESFKVHFVNLGPSQLPQHVRALGDDFSEEIVPKDPALVTAEKSLARKLGTHTEDLAAALHPELAPAWLEAIKRAVRRADVVVCSHPYGYPALRRVSDAPFVYESHNVEADLKRGIYGRHAWAADMVKWVERHAAQHARALTACSTEDASRMRELYAMDPDKRIVIVPNGINLRAVPHRVAPVKAKRRSLVGAQRPLALFMGSAHGPNIEAARLIIAAAEQVPELDFVIMGSVCHALADDRRPPNVGLVGVVSNEEKAMWLDLAEYGLNPILSGSGTNLKLVEYAAAGVLIVGTEFGARGAGFVAGEQYLDCDGNQIAAGLRRAIEADDQTRQRIVDNAYASVQANSDWSNIARPYVDLLQGVLAG